MPHPTGGIHWPQVQHCSWVQPLVTVSMIQGPIFRPWEGGLAARVGAGWLERLSIFCVKSDLILEAWVGLDLRGASARTREKGGRHWQQGWLKGELLCGGSCLVFPEVNWSTWCINKFLNLFCILKPVHWVCYRLNTNWYCNKNLRWE